MLPRGRFSKNFLCERIDTARRPLSAGFQGAMMSTVGKYVRYRRGSRVRSRSPATAA